MKNINLSIHVVRFLFFALILILLIFIGFGIKELIIPISIAFLVSLFLNPYVYLLESLGIPRLMSVVITLAVFLLILYLVIYFFVPFIVEQINKIYEIIKYISSKLPEIIAKLKEEYKDTLPFDISKLDIDTNWILSFVLEPVASTHFVEILPNLLTFAIITPILLFIFMLEGDEIYRYLMSLVPNRFFEMTLMITYKIRYGIISYLRGLLIQMLILLLILLPGLVLIKLPYGIILAIFASLINVVPYFGPALGFIPILSVSLLTDPSLTPAAILIFGFAQLVDNVFTQPVILARSVNVHPIIAILAFITFQKWFGFVGMLIAIPLAGIILMTIETMYRSLKAFDII
ncbi:MAG: AI-2E family transporter [Leptospiraceae bacterium]|nr:AI-2E family transporter [Leptospiraceae bacterium]MDW7977012.1 AI-2E family transporter [Leptospiraceae bacterium]